MGNNRIAWTFQDYYPNYNCVYLWHEILHSFFDLDEKTHALIELITNEELRISLNGGEYPPFIGHDYLNDTKLKNLETWKTFLKSKNKKINNIVEKFVI